MYRPIFITFAFMVLMPKLVGCAGASPDADPTELYIESGGEMRTALHPDTEGALVTSVVACSDSGRTLEVVGVPVNLYGVLSRNLEDSMVNLRFVRGGDRVELTERLTPAGSLEFLTFQEPIEIPPGACVQLLLLADIPAGASNRVEIEIGAPSPTGRALLPAIVYADTGESVAEERIEGNVAHRAFALIGE